MALARLATRVMARTGANADGDYRASAALGVIVAHRSLHKWTAAQGTATRSLTRLSAWPVRELILPPQLPTASLTEINGPAAAA